MSNRITWSVIRAINCFLHPCFQIKARPGTWGLGFDPCPDTWKYFTMDYKCTKDGYDLPKTFACEGESLEVSCTKGRVLDIISATYGRQVRGRPLII